MKWFDARLCGAAVLATTLLLAGCSSVGLTTDKIDYGRAVSPKTLDVPPELSQLPRDDRFAVPERGSATASATVGARAAAQPGAMVAVAPASPNARIERAGSQRWLIVNVAPE